jgi:hypothetical protein
MVRKSLVGSSDEAMEAGSVRMDLHIYLVATLALFIIAQFETQRWIRSTSGGVRMGAKTDTSILLNLSVNVTYFLSIIFCWGLITLFLISGSWKLAILVVLLRFLVMYVYGWICEKFRVKDNSLVWATSAVGLWPLGIIAGRIVASID